MPKRTAEEAQDLVLNHTAEKSKAQTQEETDLKDILNRVRQFKKDQAKLLFEAVEDKSYLKNPDLQRLGAEAFIDQQPDLLDAAISKLDPQSGKYQELQEHEKKFYQHITANAQRLGIEPISWNHSTSNIGGITETENNLGSVKLRSVSLPTQLDPAEKMDIFLAVSDANGKRISKDNPLYFSAHYDEMGKLVEMSMPKPVQLGGKDTDPISFQHGENTYYLPINTGQYRLMQKEILKNKGVQIEDLTIENLAADFALSASPQQRAQAAQKQSLRSFGDELGLRIDTSAQSARGDLPSPGTEGYDADSEAEAPRSPNSPTAAPQPPQQQAGLLQRGLNAVWSLVGLGNQSAAQNAQQAPVKVNPLLNMVQQIEKGVDEASAALVVEPKASQHASGSLSSPITPRVQLQRSPSGQGFSK